MYTFLMCQRLISKSEVKVGRKILLSMYYVLIINYNQLLIENYKQNKN